MFGISLYCPPWIHAICFAMGCNHCLFKIDKNHQLIITLERSWQMKPKSWMNNFLPYVVPAVYHSSRLDFVCHFNYFQYNVCGIGHPCNHRSPLHQLRVFNLLTLRITLFLELLPRVPHP